MMKNKPQPASLCLANNTDSKPEFLPLKTQLAVCDSVASRVVGKRSSELCQTIIFCYHCCLLKALD